MIILIILTSIFSTLIVLVGVIYLFLSKKPIAQRIHNLILNVLSCVYLTLCAPIYNNLTEKHLIDYSQQYAYIFMALLFLASFLPSIIFQMAQIFKGVKFKFIHFFGMLIAYAVMLFAVCINCYLDNQKFRYLLLFVPLTAIFSILILALTMLDVSDAKQFVTALTVNILAIGSIIAMLAISIFTVGMFTVSSIVMCAIFALLLAFSIVLPTIARKQQVK